MDNELEVCAAAFFRSKGKDTVTVNEFKMSISLEFKWVSVKEAEQLMSALISAGLIVKNGDYLKPSKDFSSVQVPMAYKPSETLKKSLSGTSTKTVAPKKRAAQTEGQPDVFFDLINVAVEHGIPKAKFVAESNALRKKLGVQTCVAALLLLRDSGVDIKKWEDRAYAQVLR